MPARHTSRVWTAGIVYGVNYFTSDAAQTKAGDCATVSGTQAKPEFKTVECASPAANYTVGKVLASTSESCGGDYDQYTETARRGPDSKLCLVPNLTEGTCYDFNGTTMGYPAIACDAAGAAKVVKAAKGVADESVCENAAAVVYPEPKLTYCVGQAV